MQFSEGRRQLKVGSLLGTGLATVSIGILQLGVAISLAALIFSGPLASGAGRASVGFILGTAIVSGAIGLRSRVSTVIAGAQDTAAILAAAVAASIAASPNLASAQRVPTVVVMIALAGVLAGIAMWVIGRYRLSGVVRFLPYPVISGFLAGTGWLLFRGGVVVMHGSDMGLGQISDLLKWSSFQFIAPGLVLGLFTVLCLRTRINNMVVSLAILVGTVGFHIVGRLVSDLETLEQRGWMIGPFPAESKWAPVGPQDLADADWSVLVDHGLPIVALVTVSIVGMLLNLSGLEEIVDHEIDLDHELKLTGPTNVAVGAVGGLVGYHLAGSTILAHHLGVRGRLVPVLIAMMAGLAFFFGADFVALVPRGVAGGVLIGLGVNLLATWVQDARRRMNRSDRVLSGLILAIIALVGILPGVGSGVLIAALIFVFSYSRLDPVRHVVLAAGRSNVDRAGSHQALLAANRGKVITVELQGYLFFGSAVRLKTVLAGLINDEEPHVGDRFVVIDMRRVAGVDSTAAAGIAKVAHRLAAHSVTTVWSGVPEGLVAGLERNGVAVRVNHRDLDHAVQWCEERILADAPELTLTGEFEHSLPDAITGHLQVLALDAGEILITSGDHDRAVYFVDQGSLSAWAETDNGKSTRLRQVMPGSILGEVSFCTGMARTATVIADGPVVVRVLQRATYDELVRSNPAAALELQQYLSMRLAERVSTTSQMVKALLG